MYSLKSRILLNMGLRCVDFGATVRGRVIRGKRTYVASGAELICNHGDVIEIGDDTRLFKGVLLHSYGNNIRIGSNCSINPYTVIYGHGGVEIGNDVLIAASCVIVPANHNFNRLDTPIRAQGLTCKGIRIEDDVWLGAHVSVLDGVTIGTGSVIGAGAVVTRDIPPYSIAVGVPAKVISSRKRGEPREM